MSNPIQFRPGISARVLLVVTPDAWVEAAKRTLTRAPLRMGDRPYTAKEAAAAFGALTAATAHRVIAEGDELLVEVAISESEMPESLRAEWQRLKTVVEQAQRELVFVPVVPVAVENGKSLQEGSAPKAAVEDEPTTGHRA